MTKRKFYRRIVTLEFITEGEHPGAWTIEDAIWDATNGNGSMQELFDQTETVNGRFAAEILISQGSSPDFFRLTPDGEDVE
jgi:hypothetical protein